MIIRLDANHDPMVGKPVEKLWTPVWVSPRDENERILFLDRSTGKEIGELGPNKLHQDTEGQRTPEVKKHWSGALEVLNKSFPEFDKHGYFIKALERHDWLYCRRPKTLIENKPTRYTYSVNRKTLSHQDLSSVGWASLYSFGKFSGWIILPRYGLRLELKPGTVFIFRQREFHATEVDGEHLNVTLWRKEGD